MALRFLADHCISNFIIRTLQDAKHEVLRLKDLLPVESSDAVVIAKAQEIDAVRNARPTPATSSSSAPASLINSSTAEMAPCVSSTSI